jgi:serine/threonine-protein phosphatase PGAM5
MPKRFLYLIRHGQYLSTPDLPYGKLTRLGEEQADLTGRFLVDVPLRVIYTSSMSRAAETARIINANFYKVPIRQDNLLRECVPTVPPRLEAHYTEYARHSPDFTLADVLTHRMQADDAFSRYFKPPPPGAAADGHEALVCHGNIIRYFISRAMDAPPDSWANLFMLNCGISIVRVDDQGLMTVMTHNNVEHLPAHLRTEL